MTLGEREAADLQRGRAYIAAARPPVHVPQLRVTMTTIDGHTANFPVNLPETLFGPYTCTRCPSYGHKTSDHGEQGVPLADRSEP